jgi:molecular chaperone GrpE
MNFTNKTAISTGAASGMGLLFAQNFTDLGGNVVMCDVNEEVLNKCVEEINAKDAVFDTDEHEALTNVPVTDESQKGKVLDVIQKGYKLNGKVIRYARVVVGG